MMCLLILAISVTRALASGSHYHAYEATMPNQSVDYLYLGEKPYDIDTSHLQSEDYEPDYTFHEDAGSTTDSFRDHMLDLTLQSGTDPTSMSYLGETSQPALTPQENYGNAANGTTPFIVRPNSSRLIRHMIRECNRLHMRIEDGPISFAEMSDHFNIGEIHQNQVTKNLVRLLKTDTDVTQAFINAFRQRRRMIADSRAEVKFYRDQSVGRRSDEYEELMNKIVIEMLVAHPEMQTMSVEDLEMMTRSAASTMYTKRNWDRAVLRFMVQERGIKDAAYFQRLRMIHEGRHRKPRCPVVEDVDADRIELDQ